MRVSLETFTRDYIRRCYIVERLSDDLVACVYNETSNGHTIRIWDLESRELMGQLIGHNDRIYSLRYLGNNILASGSSEGEIKVWNLESNQVELTLDAHFHRVTAIEPLTIYGTLFASGSWDHKIKVWNILTQQCVRTITLPYRIETHALAWLGKVDGSRLLASGHNHRTACVWDMSKSEDLPVFIKAYEDHPVSALSVLSNGLLAMTSRNDIMLWNVTSQTCVANLTGHEDAIVTLQTTNLWQLNV